MFLPSCSLSDVVSGVIQRATRFSEQLLRTRVMYDRLLLTIEISLLVRFTQTDALFFISTSACRIHLQIIKVDVNWRPLFFDVSLKSTLSLTKDGLVLLVRIVDLSLDGVRVVAVERF